MRVPTTNIDRPSGKNEKNKSNNNNRVEDTNPPEEYL